jgi:hypothetical protein
MGGVCYFACGPRLPRASERFDSGLRRLFGASAPPVPSPAEARRRMQSKPGFFASLTAEQREEIRLGHSEPEAVGPANPSGDAAPNREECDSPA